MGSHWKEPKILLQSYFALEKLMHVIAGIVIWHTVTNLDFDLGVLTGKRARRWTIWIYFTGRICGIGLVVTPLVFMGTATEINCEAVTVFFFTLVAVACASTSLLVVLRLVAIWDRYPPVVALSVVAWLCATAFFIRLIPLVRWTWGTPFPKIEGSSPQCYLTHLPSFISLSVVTLCVNAVLFSVMIFGLLRKPHLDAFGLWRFLYHQGLAWLIIAILAEVPVLVLLSLDLNDVLNLMLQVPKVIITTMAATTMYRELCKYTSISEREVSGFKTNILPPSAMGLTDHLRALEVAVHTTYEQHIDGEAIMVVLD